MVRTGSSVYLKYGKEATFAGGATGTRVFGLEQKLTGISWKNNQIPIAQLNDIEIACYAYGKNEGAGSVEFVMSTPWIFDILLDGVNTSGSAADFSHKWSSSNTFGDTTTTATITTITTASPVVVTTSTSHGYNNGDLVAITGSDSVPSIDGIWAVSSVTSTTFELVGASVDVAGTAGTVEISINLGVKVPHTMHIEYGHDAETNDVVRNMKGVVLKSLALKASLGETVKVTADLAWGNEDAISTTLSNAIDDDIKFPYTFAHATLELPNSTVVAQIQEFELTFNTNAELLYGMGSADAVSAFRKIFEMTGKFKAAQVDKIALQRVFDAADGTTSNLGIATLKVTLTNGLANALEKSIVLAFSGVGVSEHQTEAQPGEPIFETLSWQLRSVNVDANNSIAVPA